MREPPRELLDTLRAAAVVLAGWAPRLRALAALVEDDGAARALVAAMAMAAERQCLTLRGYLAAAHHAPLIGEGEVAAARRIDVPIEGPVEARLMQLVLRAELAWYFFRRLGERAADPALAELLTLAAADAAHAADDAHVLLAARAARDPAVVMVMLDAATRLDPAGEALPVAFPGDPLALRAIARRVEALCGVRLVDHLKATPWTLSPRAIPAPASAAPAPVPGR